MKLLYYKFNKIKKSSSSDLHVNIHVLFDHEKEGIVRGVDRRVISYDLAFAMRTERSRTKIITVDLDASTLMS